jgi:hypothetical protein
LTEEEVRAYLSRIGKKGGSATGEVKRRGGKKYYQTIARKRWAKKKPITSAP